MGGISLGGSERKTTNYNDNRSTLDNSVNEVGMGAVATMLDVSGGDNAAISIEVTDQGAVQGALSTVDRSMDSLTSSFSAMLGSSEATANNAIKSVERSFQSDSKGISQSAFMWVGLAVLGFVALKIIKG